jgi:hypothetical protein
MVAAFRGNGCGLSMQGKKKNATIKEAVPSCCGEETAL